MSPSGVPVRTASAAFALPLEGLRLLGRERSLWKWAAVPFALCLAALVLTVLALVEWADVLWVLCTGWLPALAVDAWYEWLWLGPLKLLLGLVGAVLFVGACGVALVAAWLAAGVLAAPFHDVLSRRVEALVTGGLLDRSAPGLAGALREGGRAVLEELRRLVFFLGVQALIAFLGFAIPGAQVLVPPAMLLFTVLFLPLDYASYTLDRRRVGFAGKRRWVMAHRSAMLGFGLAAFLTFLVPGLNFAAMPVLVVSGTLLALRTPLPD